MSKINEAIKKDIDNGNIDVARTSLAQLAYFQDEDSFDSFVETRKYLEERTGNAYEPDDAFVSEKSTLKEKFADTAAQLMNNFSKEKCDQLISIGEKLYREKSETNFADSNVQKEKIRQDRVKENENFSNGREKRKTAEKTDRSKFGGVFVFIVIIVAILVMIFKEN